MIVSFGAGETESGPAGDVVSSRRVRFGSQAEQIVFLRRMVDEYRSLYAIRARARDIVFRLYRCAPKDKVCHAIAIGSWVQQNIRYVEEIPEIFQVPTATVAQGYGDCDDFTTLIAALLESVGIESELVGMEWDGSFRHIFPRAVIERASGGVLRIPLDATLSQPISDRTDPLVVAARKGYQGLRTFVV